MTIPQRDGAVTIIPTWISNAAQSADFNTNAYNIQQFSKYALQLDITGAAGLSVSASVQATVDGTNWATVPGTTVVFTANGTYIWDNAVSAVIAVRVAFTFTSGSADFQVYAFAKL